MPTLERPSAIKLQLLASQDATRIVWTVADFIAALLAQCVPSERIDSVEFGIGQGGGRRLTVGRNEDGFVEVRER